MVYFQNGKTFGWLLDEYFTNHTQALGREERVTKHRLGKLRLAFEDQSSLAEIEVEKFVLHHKSPSSRNRYRALIKHIIRWVKERELITGDLGGFVVKMERENNGRTRRLEDEEEEKLLRWMSPRLQLLYYAAVDTGLRKGTLKKLLWEHLVFTKTGAYFDVPASLTKQKRHQRIPLTKRLVIKLRSKKSEMESMRRYMGDTIFDTRNFKSEWDYAKEQAGVKDLHWHDLRGEFASRLVEHGVDARTTQGLLGHSSLTMTEKYLRPRVGQFDDAIGKLGV